MRKTAIAVAMLLVLASAASAASGASGAAGVSAVAAGASAGILRRARTRARGDGFTAASGVMAASGAPEAIALKTRSVWPGSSFVSAWPNQVPAIASPTDPPIWRKKVRLLVAAPSLARTCLT